MKNYSVAGSTGIQSGTRHHHIAFGMNRAGPADPPSEPSRRSTDSSSGYSGLPSGTASPTPGCRPRSEPYPDGGHFFADRIAHDHRLAVPNHDGCRDITAGKHRHGHVEEIEVAAADRDAGTVLIQSTNSATSGAMTASAYTSGSTVGVTFKMTPVSRLEGAGVTIGAMVTWLSVSTVGCVRSEFSRVNDFAHDLNLGVDTAAGGHARCGQQVRAPVLGERACSTTVTSGLVNTLRRSMPPRGARCPAARVIGEAGEVR